MILLKYANGMIEWYLTFYSHAKACDTFLQFLMLLGLNFNPSLDVSI